MNIVAFAASNSRQSINKKLVTHACDVLRERFSPHTTVRMLDLNDYDMPVYGIDYENDVGIPEAAERFLADVSAADALVISFAEHNGSYTAAYKSIFDWASRIQTKVYDGKPMLLMSASPGKSGASSVLQMATQSVPFFGGTVCASFSVGPFDAVFDGETGALCDTAMIEALERSIAALQAYVKPD